MRVLIVLFLITAAAVSQLADTPAKEICQPKQDNIQDIKDIARMIEKQVHEEISVEQPKLN